MAARRQPALTRMTVAEFQEWVPPELAEHRWQLVDGEPVCMAPASDNHGRIQAEAAFLLAGHLRSHRPGCAVVAAPGVIPRVRPESNHRIPDLGVTCSPPPGGQFIDDPVLLIEIVSPSNEAETRENVRAYTTVPSVQDILLLSSTGVRGELLNRLIAWPDTPLMIGPEDPVCLASIGLVLPLRDFYRTTNLR